VHVGDNVEPQVKNAAFLVYDEKYLYAGFRFEDPNPGAVRAPLGDHDAVPSSTDYAGVIVDSHNDGKTRRCSSQSPRRSVRRHHQRRVGEDDSRTSSGTRSGRSTGPAGRSRSGFRSHRCATPIRLSDWGMLLYRNYRATGAISFFSAKLPRDVSCFICNSSKMTGLANLPHGSHLVVAPYATAQQSAVRSPISGAA